MLNLNSDLNAFLKSIKGAKKRALNEVKDFYFDEDTKKLEVVLYPYGFDFITKDIDNDHYFRGSGSINLSIYLKLDGGIIELFDSKIEFYDDLQRSAIREVKHELKRFNCGVADEYSIKWSTKVDKYKDRMQDLIEAIYKTYNNN